MPAGLDNTTSLHHQHPITGSGGSQLMADEQHRALAVLAEVVQDAGRCGVVHTGKGVIQHQKGRLLQQCPGQGTALPLTTAEGDAPFSHHGVQPVGEGFNVPAELSGSSVVGHLLSFRIRLAIAQVVLHGGGEQIGLLMNQGNTTS